MRRTLARQTLDALPDFSIGASGVSFKQTVVIVDECRVTEFCHHQDTSKPEVFFTPFDLHSERVCSYEVLPTPVFRPLAEALSNTKTK